MFSTTTITTKKQKNGTKTKKNSYKNASLHEIYFINYIIYILNQKDVGEWFVLRIVWSWFNLKRHLVQNHRAREILHSWDSVIIVMVNSENRPLNIVHIERDRALGPIEWTNETIKQCYKISPRANWPNKIVAGI